MTPKFAVAAGNVTSIRLCGALSAVVLSLTVFAAHVRAQAIGVEFQVNTSTTLSQVDADAAADPAGNVTVVWRSIQDLSLEWEIYGQRYNASGARLGAQFHVNSPTTDSEWAPAVAAGVDGRFVVAWMRTPNLGIFAQRYDAAGLPVGPEIAVTRAPFTGYPDVAVTPDGGMVFVWRTQPAEVAGVGWAVYGRRYDPSGLPIGDAFQINEDAISWGSSYPTIGCDSVGNFIVAWDDIGTSIRARRFSAEDVGDPEFVIDADGSAGYPSIAVAPAGDFVVTWRGAGATVNDHDIFVRRYLASTVAAAPRVRVNTSTYGRHEEPAIAMDDAGKVMLTWKEPYVDGSNVGVFGQWYTAGGAPIGDNFQVNTTTAGQQDEAVVVATRRNTFMAVWQDVGADGDTWGIFGKRLRIPGDLVISTLSAPSGAAPSSFIPVTVTTLNQGGQTVAPSTTMLRWSTDTNADASDPILAAGEMPFGLAADASASATVSVQIPTTVPGYYYLIAVADGEDAAIEASETNNTAVRQIGIGPDLVIRTLAVPTSATRGSTITIRDTTGNTGASMGGFSTTRLVLSRDGILSATDLVIASRTVVPLSAGSSSLGITSFVVPASLPTGTYTLFAIADAEWDVPEISETNNRRSVTITIQ